MAHETGPHRALCGFVLTARRATDDRLEGFEAGADDYLTKPFAFADLVARARRCWVWSCPRRDGSARAAYVSRR